jgi:hypothetical protein
MMVRKQSRWNRWVALGAVGIALVICLFSALVVYVFQGRPQQKAAPTAVLMVIPAPTATQTPTRSQLTPTADAAQVSENGISRGMYVQISGTSGEGLRIRSGPGTSNSPKFLGMDAEVFKVTDGPEHADGMTWWYLVAPYDETRSGWAAADYLSVVANPE